jgi:hypothetical protein
MGDGWQVFGLTQERIQRRTYRVVFNRADLFKQKLDFIKAEVIVKQQYTPKGN